MRPPRGRTFDTQPLAMYIRFRWNRGKPTTENKPPQFHGIDTLKRTYSS
jgi:hypothetical protein